MGKKKPAGSTGGGCHHQPRVDSITVSPPVGKQVNCVTTSLPWQAAPSAGAMDRSQLARGRGSPEPEWVASAPPWGSPAQAPRPPPARGSGGAGHPILWERARRLAHVPWPQPMRPPRAASAPRGCHLAEGAEPIRGGVGCAGRRWAEGFAMRRGARAVPLGGCLSGCLWGGPRVPGWLGPRGCVVACGPRTLRPAGLGWGDAGGGGGPRGRGRHKAGRSTPRPHRPHRAPRPPVQSAPLADRPPPGPLAPPAITRIPPSNRHPAPAGRSRARRLLRPPPRPSSDAHLKGARGGTLAGSRGSSESGEKTPPPAAGTGGPPSIRPAPHLS